MRGKVFQNVGGLRPGRSVFDLSYEYKTQCDMGQLIPVYVDEVVPGDIFDMSVMAILRTQPMVAPLMHEVSVFFHTFYIPNRILWNEKLGDAENWEEFITGGEDGQDASTLPTWVPTVAQNNEGSLWDYLGFPIDVEPLGAAPSDLIRRAYYMIWNEYYRDQNVEAAVDITDPLEFGIKNRNWEKDYFTSALPFQQRGTSPAIPITGTSSAVWETTVFENAVPSADLGAYDWADDDKLRISGVNNRNNVEAAFNDNEVDLSDATPIDVADLRESFKIQEWLERNARAGARYTEFLKSHFGTSPTDARLQRPEYVGGTRSPLIVSEVLQTSETSVTPQGQLTGHGISVNNGRIGRLRATEFGIVMTLMSIMPRPGYQQGVPRKWCRYSKYDYYFPEFAHLSEQAILQHEIFASGVAAENETIFGYTGQYDEMRINHNVITNQFRSDALTPFDYWHLARDFASAPTLNASFLKCDPRKDIFASSTDPGFMVQIGNRIKAIRPMPFIAEPGL